MNYTFGGGNEQQQVSSEILPEGDYNFRVLECGEPYLSPKGRWVVKVKLSILPSDQWVWDQPWSGKTEAGEKRDGIGDFLLAIGRAPTIGKEVDWDSIAGARGKCKLRQGDITLGSRKGQKRNEVHYYYRPKEIGPTSGQPPRQNYSPEEYNQARRQQEAKSAGSSGPDLAAEPEDIPFSCDRG